MAPMAETPHTQNRNGSLKGQPQGMFKMTITTQAVSQEAQRVKGVYSRATQKSSQSHNATQNT